MAADQTKEAACKKTLFVAAIDIGTTYSGWAYSIMKEPDKVYTNQVWVSGSGQLASLKAPSCVLLNPQQEFVAFGYEAETKYAELAEEDEHGDWYYFHRFKMALYNDKILKYQTTLEDITGKEMPALEIFAHVIRFMKDNCLHSLRNRIFNLLETDVNYVLTVPAIWDDLAKRFMRLAANEAGIPDDQLMLALEPEAASIWCQGIYTEVQRDTDFVDLGISAVGTKYMIVDLGGGTADITVHEKRPNDTLLEIHKATGGAWGGIEVDEQYLKLLADVIDSEEHWAGFKKENVECMLDIKRDFEFKKRTMSTTTKGYITVKTPSSLSEVYIQTGKPFTKIKERFDNKIEWKKDKLRIDESFLKKCFDDPLNRILKHVKEILSDEKMRNVNKIILVGGFSESPYVQERFKNELHGKDIIIPSECGLAVLKGAVLFGQYPKTVTSRISRYTYGLSIAVPFDHRNRDHSRAKLKETDVGQVCIDTFWKAVEIDQEIKDGHVVKRIGKAVNDYQAKIILEIVRSKERNPLYVTDPSCSVIGKVPVRMDASLTANDNAVEEIFTFGGTELKFSTIHKKTGFRQDCYFDL